MELYRKYPRFVTLWCCWETVTFAGQLFGWSSLLFVLKSEGFYDYTCEWDHSNGDKTNQTNHDIKHNNINRELPYGIQSTTQDRNATHVPYMELASSDDLGNSERYSVTLDEGLVPKIQDIHGVIKLPVTCLEQDSRLNLWFSIAIAISYASCFLLGPLLQKVGMRYFRLFIMIAYVLGALCIAFATKVTPWLICPGLSLIGLSGMALYSTNIQMSFLFPLIQSTITSVFVGLYDASTVVTQIVKTLYEHGFQRKHSFFLLIALHVFMVGTSTMFLLPSMHVNVGNKKRIPKNKGVEENTSGKTIRYINSDAKRSLSRSLVSGQYMLHVYWMSVQAIRFVTFLGFLNAWLQTKFHGDRHKESQFLSIFSYTTLGTVFSAVTAGLIHDWERKRYQSSGLYRSKRMPIIVPLVITTCMSIVTTSLTYIDSEEVLYLTFILFTIYRSYLFSFEVTFLNDAFPLKYFPVLFGVLHSSAGLAGMIQHPLFEWYRSYTNAPSHVNLFLIALEISSFVHPYYIWHQCRKHKSNTDIQSFDTEIFL